MSANPIESDVFFCDKVNPLDQNCLLFYMGSTKISVPVCLNNLSFLAFFLQKKIHSSNNYDCNVKPFLLRDAQQTSIGKYR